MWETQSDGDKNLRISIHTFMQCMNAMYLNRWHGTGLVKWDHLHLFVFGGTMDGCIVSRRGHKWHVMGHVRRDHGKPRNKNRES